MGYTASKVLEVARGELGYCEKETNSQLDNPTANAGDGNYTKYARDLYAAGYYQANKNGYAWCDVFHDYCHYIASGKDAELAQKITCQTGVYGAGCSWSAKYYKAQNRLYTSDPKPGDQIFFGTSIEKAEHTGIVEKVENGIVTTIEGNTSNKVARRTYQLTYAKIVGYGRPYYDEEDTVVEETTPATTVTGTVSTGTDAFAQKIWAYLLAKIGNEYGVAGLIGNLYAESGLRSNNMQNSYESKPGYTDVTYTAAVDNESYDNFVKDAVGYGLAQWTCWSRKQNLLAYAKECKKSIGDYEMQLAFLYKELSESYKGVLSDLKNATSVLAASNSVLTKFERPADQGESVQKKRAEFGQKYYDKYAEKKETTTETTATSKLKYGVGDIVYFGGTKHYASANSTTAKATKSCKAKITAISENSKHPYHCRAVNDSGAFISGKVYGWVDEADVAAVSTATSTTTQKTLKTGSKLKLSNVALYASSTSKTKAATKTGTYYVWSATAIRGRIRITNSAANVGKSGQIAGWINLADAKNALV